MSRPRLRPPLSKTLVESCAPGERDRYLWDGEVRGFGAKVTPAGVRSYVLQYRFGSRTRRIVIGRHGRPWTVATARERARRLLRLIGQGQDPATEQALARADVTVARLCEVFVAEGLAGRSPHYRVATRRNLENHVIPRLGAMMASTVRADHVAAVFRDVAQGATARIAPDRTASGGRQAANAVAGAMSALFAFAVRRGICRDNPARGLRKFPLRRVERFLTPGEYARLGEVLATARAIGVPNPVAVAAIRLLLLTGLRPGELLALRRDQVDGGRGVLQLIDHRGGRREIHLAAEALAVFAGLPEQPGNPHLFAGRRGRAFSDLQPAWSQLRAAAGLEDVRLLDLRHSFASRAAVARVGDVVLGRLLATRDGSTLRRYPQEDQALALTADRVSGAISRLLGDRPAASPLVGGQSQADVGRALAHVSHTTWLDPAEASRRTGLTVATLASYRCQGTGPAFRRIGARVRYPQDALEAWIEAQAAAPRRGRPPNALRRRQAEPSTDAAAKAPGRSS